MHHRQRFSACITGYLQARRRGLARRAGWTLIARGTPGTALRFLARGAQAARLPCSIPAPASNADDLRARGREMARANRAAFSPNPRYDAPLTRLRTLFARRTGLPPRCWRSAFPSGAAGGAWRTAARPTTPRLKDIKSHVHFRWQPRSQHRVQGFRAERTRPGAGDRKPGFPSQLAVCGLIFHAMF